MLFEVVSIMQKMVKFLTDFLLTRFERSNAVGIWKSAIRIDLSRSLRYLYLRPFLLWKLNLLRSNMTALIAIRAITVKLTAYFCIFIWNNQQLVSRNCFIVLKLRIRSQNQLTDLGTISWRLYCFAKKTFKWFMLVERNTHIILINNQAFKC
jgi:hypothetical protein